MSIAAAGHPLGIPGENGTAFEWLCAEINNHRAAFRGWVKPPFEGSQVTVAFKFSQLRYFDCARYWAIWRDIAISTPF